MASKVSFILLLYYEDTLLVSNILCVVINKDNLSSFVNIFCLYVKGQERLMDECVLFQRM